MNHLALLMNTELLKKNKDGFYIENVNLHDVIKKHSSPVYIYSKEHILNQVNFLRSELSGIDHLICFAVKANSNLSILNLLKNNGCGFDIVSGGELQRVLSLKGDDSHIVFSGVGKNIDEITLALKNNIMAFNIESEAELHRINAVAKKLLKIANISIRVNPNVDAKTHPYISTGLKDNKFGVDEKKALQIYKLAQSMDSINITGIDCHIGSQITNFEPFEDAFTKIAQLIEKIQALGINITHIDIGGGIGISYENESISPLKNYILMIKKHLSKFNKKIILEPGRFLVGKSGLLLTKIEYIKKSDHKNFIIVDAAMNDLMRPSLYNAYHKVINVSNNKSESSNYDIVGPICETGDFLAKNRTLSASEGDYLVLLDAGAYGFSMSSNYNSRPKIAEIMIDKGEFFTIREKETFEDLIQKEITYVI